jgi:hypothetical protein
MRALRCLATGAFVLAAGAAPAAVEAPPRERDCARWVEAAAPMRRLPEAEAAASGAPASAYADRVPNVELLSAARRPVSLELLHCEQLNLKDKLDLLIRRLAR